MGRFTQKQEKTMNQKGIDPFNWTTETKKVASIPTNFLSSDFIVIDFETATAKRNSACAIGMVACRDYQIIGTYKQLLKPPKNEYLPFNTQLHGITPTQTKTAPTIADLYNKGLDSIIDSEVQLVAHNASFDMSVLRESLGHHGIDTPWIQAICTVDVARELYPSLPNHKLNTVAKHIGHQLEHHDPISDALAAAAIMLKWMDIHGAKLIEERKIRELLPYINEQHELFSLHLQKAQGMEKTDLKAAARLYMESINMMKHFDTHCRNNGVSPERPRMAINRLTITLERAGLTKGCLEAISWYREYNDPIGLNKSDEDTLAKRCARMEKRLAKG
jgi:DNA polymerase-3 subunit epsilon